MNKQEFFFLIFALFFSVYIFPLIVFAVATLSENETVANVPASTIPSITFANGTAAVNGTIPVITFAGGVTEIKATRTLSVTGLPLAGETVVFGTCTITFQDGGEDIFDETDCSNNTAIINRADSVGVVRSIADFSAAVRTITNVSDTGHGALTVSGATTNVIFTTTGTEASATVNIYQQCLKYIFKFVNCRCGGGSGECYYLYFQRFSGECFRQLCSNR
ncbi:MAG: hypothetical protein AAB726_01725 [Patescibacteria group bacterium]